MDKKTILHTVFSRILRTLQIEGGHVKAQYIYEDRKLLAPVACLAELTKDTKRSSNTLLRLVSFFATQTFFRICFMGRLGRKNPLHTRFQLRPVSKQSNVPKPKSS